MNIITFSDRLSKFMMILAAAWTFAISFLVLGDIVGRSVFDAPIHGTAEMVAAVGRLPEGLIAVLTRRTLKHAQEMAQVG